MVKTILLCISIDVLYTYFRFLNIILLGTYVLQSNNFNF